MSPQDERRIEMTRTSKGRYEVVNARGGRIELGNARDEAFTPVELMLAAIAGCTAIDVDFITSKRSEPTRFAVAMTADKVRDEHGNHLTNLSVSFDVAFPEDEGGAAAAEVLPGAVQASHDRLCTVSRTVELGTPVEVTVGGAQVTPGPAGRPG